MKNTGCLIPGILLIILIVGLGTYDVVTYGIVEPSGQQLTVEPVQPMRWVPTTINTSVPAAQGDYPITLTTDLSTYGWARVFSDETWKCHECGLEIVSPGKPQWLDFIFCQRDGTEIARTGVMCPRCLCRLLKMNVPMLEKEKEKEKKEKEKEDKKDKKEGKTE